MRIRVISAGITDAIASRKRTVCRLPEPTSESPRRQTNRTPPCAPGGDRPPTGGASPAARPPDRAALEPARPSENSAPADRSAFCEQPSAMSPVKAIESIALAMERPSRLPSRVGFVERVRPGHVPRALIAARARVVEHRTVRSKDMLLQVLPRHRGKVPADERRILVQDRRMHGADDHRRQERSAVAVAHHQARAPRDRTARPDRGGCRRRTSRRPSPSRPRRAAALRHAFTAASTMPSSRLRTYRGSALGTTGSASLTEHSRRSAGRNGCAWPRSCMLAAGTPVSRSMRFRARRAVSRPTKTASLATSISGVRPSERNKAELSSRSWTPVLIRSTNG